MRYVPLREARDGGPFDRKRERNRPDRRGVARVCRKLFNVTAPTAVLLWARSGRSRRKLVTMHGYRDQRDASEDQVSSC